MRQYLWRFNAFVIVVLLLKHVFTLVKKTLRKHYEVIVTNVKKKIVSTKRTKIQQQN